MADLAFLAVIVVVFVMIGLVARGVGRL